MLFSSIEKYAQRLSNHEKIPVRVLASTQTATV